MTSELEKYSALAVTVLSIWKRAVNCPTFSIWFDISNQLDYFSTVSRCSKKAREELKYLSTLAELIGIIKLENLKKEKS